MKAKGRRSSACVVSSCLEPQMKHEARVFDMTSQMKQYRFIQCHIFGSFFLKCCHMHNLLYFAIWYYNLCKAEAFRLREPKTVVEEEDLVDKAIPSSTKYKNKWAVTIFNEWQTARKVRVPGLYWIPEVCLKIMICTRLEYCQLKSKIWMHCL